MTFNFMIAGPNGTRATLTESQLKLAQPVLLRVANAKHTGIRAGKTTTTAEAQRDIEKLLADAGEPLQFEAVKP